MKSSLLKSPIYVYRIQNSKGNGVYRPEETSKSKKISSPYHDDIVLHALDYIVRKFSMRYSPMDSDVLSQNELLNFMDGDYYSAFSSLPQLFSWFPFVQEIMRLQDYGYFIYRIEAKKIITIENQSIFIPACELGKCSKILTKEMFSQDDDEKIFDIVANRKEMALSFIKKIKKGSYIDKTFFKKPNVKKLVEKIIRES